MPTLAEIISKGMARISKMAEKEKAIKEGRPLPIKSALNNLQRIQRAAAKDREAYMKAVIKNRDGILGKDIPAAEIAEGRGIATKAVNQAQDLIQNGWKRKAILQFEVMICEIKEAVADFDIDGLVMASEAYDDFIEGLNEYTLDILSKSEEIDTEKVKKLWSICMPENNVKALSRKSTPYDAIDVFRYDTLRALNKANNVEEVTGIINGFIKQVNLRFKSWGLDFEVPTND